MSPHEHDHLPPELRDVAEHLRAPQVTPSDDALDAAMTRAQRVRPDRRRGLSLRASGPRMSGRTRAIALAGAFGLVGMTGAAVVVNSSGSGGSGLPVVKADAASHQYVPPGQGGCPDIADPLVLTRVQAANLLAVLVADINPDADELAVIVDITAQLEDPGNLAITVCVRVDL